MTMWPLFTRPEGDLDELVEMYPEIAAAKAEIGVFPEGIFAQWPIEKLDEMRAAAGNDRADGHEARPILAELKRADGTLEYHVMNGPKCFHGCAACAHVHAEEKEHYDSQGAIGVFADSSGGEMERLRQQLGHLAQVIQTVIGPMAQRMDALEAAQKPAPAELAEKSEPGAGG